MPLLADRVRETTTTTGTGTLTLDGAAVGFQSFNTAFSNGATVYYCIQGGSEWEIGIGTVGTGTLARTTVLQSSNADALVPLSAGTKDVFCTYVADRAVTTSDASTLTNKIIDDYTNDVGANSTHFRIKAGATLAKGDVVKASGFTPGEAAIEVVKTASATDVALGIVEQALTTGQFGTAVVIGELFDVNTNGLSVGAALYQNGAGGWTTTKPSSGLYQSLGWVVRANTNNGVVAVNVVNPQYVEASTNTASTLVLRDGSGNFSAGTITATLAGSASSLTTTRTLWGQNFDGTANVTGSLTSVGDITGTAGVTLTATAGTLALAATGANIITATTNSSERIRITSAGRVGINQTAPASLLHLNNVAIPNSTFSVVHVTGSSPFISSTDGTRQAIMGTATAENAAIFGSFTNHNVSFRANNTTILSLTPSGSVVLNGGTQRIGISNTSPSYPLHIGNSAVPSAVGQIMVCDTNAGISVTDGNRQLVIGTDFVNNSFIGEVASFPLTFRTNNTGRWQISNSGHLLAATDATYDIGASGATRPRNVYVSSSIITPGSLASGGSFGVRTNSIVIGDGTTSSGGVDMRAVTGQNMAFSFSQAGVAAGSWTIVSGGGRQEWDSPANPGYLWKISGTEVARFNSTSLSLTAGLIFATDATYDIGASGATRPRDIYLSGSVTAGATASAGRFVPTASTSGGNNNCIFLPAANTIGIHSGGSHRWSFDPSGHFIPATDNVYNIGGPSNRIANFYLTGSISTDATITAGRFVPTSNTSGGNANVIYLSGTNTIGFQTNSVLQWTINASGHLVPGTDNAVDIGVSGTARVRNYVSSGSANVGTCVSVGGATPSTSGAGITFPATQSASSDANTLDDYEEGTWTPNLGGTATYTSRVGNYVKIGRMVSVRCELIVNAIGTGDTKVITGLPFSAGINGQGPVGYFSDLATNVVFIVAQVGTNSPTSVNFRTLTAAGGTVATDDVFKNATYVEFSLIYYV